VYVSGSNIILILYLYKEDFFIIAVFLYTVFSYFIIILIFYFDYFAFYNYLSFKLKKKLIVITAIFFIKLENLKYDFININSYFYFIFSLKNNLIFSL